MSRPQLLLLHGAIGSSAQFDKLAHLLKDHFELHTLDFSGHGKKAAATEFGIRKFSEEISDFLEQKQLDKVNVFGYSMGGYTAMYHALEQPGRIDRLVVLGTKFAWTAEYAAQETRKLDPAKILEKVPQFAADLEKRHGADRWKDLLKDTAAMMENLGREPLLTTETISQLNIPVRIAIGDRDNTLTYQEAVEFYQAIPGAELEVFPGTPHPIERVSPERLAFSIKEFFRD
jgi:pimeloyl-ACP methyl ester carboxylesterase